MVTTFTTRGSSWVAGPSPQKVAEREVQAGPSKLSRGGHQTLSSGVAGGDSQGG